MATHKRIPTCCATSSSSFVRPDVTGCEFVVVAADVATDVSTDVLTDVKADVLTDFSIDDSIDVSSGMVVATTLPLTACTGSAEASRRPFPAAAWP
jgi:hypothetical protein